jgi:hypothetical protein
VRPSSRADLDLASIAFEQAGELRSEGPQGQQSLHQFAKRGLRRRRRIDDGGKQIYVGGRTRQVSTGSLQPLVADDHVTWTWSAGPGAKTLGLGTDFSRESCSYAPRFEGDGAYLSCAGSDAGPTFTRYDQGLNDISTIPGNQDFVIAADARDQLLVESADGTRRWRWVDTSLSPLSDYFPAPTPAFGLQPLIGGGFVDSNRRLIPPPGSAVSATPQWMIDRSIQGIVLGGHAYALGAGDCGLEIRDPNGIFCGSVEIENCRAPPVPGFDGSITIATDASHYITNVKLVTWPRLLH